MSRYFSLLVSVGLLPPLLVAVGALDCSEKETLLRPMSSPVTKVTDCLMECTGMTYIRKLQLDDKQNIRLEDSTEGDLGEYCWSTELKCKIGESFHRAYAVLPVDLSEVGPGQLDVRTTVPSGTTLRADSSPSTIADGCGLRYDVTEHFSKGTAETSFCVQVRTQEDGLGDRVLKCPPYLVTLWKRSPDGSIQQGDG